VDVYGYRTGKRPPRSLGLNRRDAEVLGWALVVVAIRTGGSQLPPRVAVLRTGRGAGTVSGCRHRVPRLHSHRAARTVPSPDRL